MAHELTQDIVLKMADPSVGNNDPIWKSQPILQVVMLKQITSNKTSQVQERKRGAVSDGKHYVQVMFTTQLNDLIEEDQLQRLSIIRIKHMTCNIMQDKRLIVVLELDVLAQTDDKIGAPLAAESLFLKGGGGETEVQSPPASKAIAAPPVQNKTQYVASTSAQSSSSRPAAAPAAPARTATRAPPDLTIYPIEALSPYQNRWAIKARVTQKSDIKTWSNSRSGDGKLFSCTLMDESGEIRATAFTKAVDALYDKLEENKVYYISKARVGVAKKKFSNLPNEYEITLEASTEIQQVEDEQGVPLQKFSFRKISELQDIEKDVFIDIIAIVTDVGEKSTITAKASQREIVKRELTVVDSSGQSVRLTLWGKQAEQFDFGNKPVVAFKGVKVGDYNGRTLSLPAAGSMIMSPDISESHELRGWYDSQGSSVTFTSQTKAGGGGSGPVKRDELTTLQEARDAVDQYLTEEAVAAQTGGEKPERIFVVRAMVVHIRNDDKMFYSACSKCNKKMSEDGQCQSCAADGNTGTTATWRYLLNAAVADNTSQMWMSAFNEAATVIMGMSAQDLYQQKTDLNDNEFNNLIKKTCGRLFLIVVKARRETYMDQSRVKYSILRLVPLEFEKECEAVIKEIDEYGLFPPPPPRPAA